MAKPTRPGAGNSKKKGASKGTGGHSRKALEGRGPTPKAEDRAWHVAGKRKAAAERYAAAGGKGKPGQRPQSSNSNRSGKSKAGDDTETVTGRNSVLEALRARIPATAFYIAQRVEMDDRVKEMLAIATHRGIPVLEVTRPELDRMAGFDGVHQGVAIKVPPYEYAHPQDLLEEIINGGSVPLLIALDGITDPRNLGAIIRSTAAFGGHGVIVPSAVPRASPRPRGRPAPAPPRASRSPSRPTSPRRSRSSRSRACSCSDSTAAAMCRCRRSSSPTGRS